MFDFILLIQKMLTYMNRIESDTSGLPLTFFCNFCGLHITSTAFIINEPQLPFDYNDLTTQHTEMNTQALY